MHIIVYLEIGVIGDPHIFSTENLAGEYFEKILTSKDLLIRNICFRTRNEGETWEEYHAAFREWEDSSECTYDKMDFEIHWFNEVAIDSHFIDTE